MVQQEQPDDYVIATGETYSLKDFIETVFSHIHLDWREHVVSNPELLLPTDIMISRANPAKSFERFGWRAQYKMADVAMMMVDAELLNG